MSFLIRNLASNLVRNQRQLLIHCNRLATDAKNIEEMTKRNKVVVFMKVNRLFLHITTN